MEKAQKDSETLRDQNQKRMAEQAKKRPVNFLELSPEDQWAIDKRLGILDWRGE